MPNKFLIAIAVMLTFNQVNATTYTTAVNGNWSNIGCWANNTAPAYTCADTIVIKHHIVLPNDLTLLSGAYMLIESTGGICGHVRIFMNAGSSILKYGILEIDALDMSGGIATMLPPGNTIFTQYGQLSGGAEFTNTSNLSVGPWFECQMPEYQFINGLDNALQIEKLNIYPNPCSHLLSIDLPKNCTEFLIKIMDAKGSIQLYQSEVNNRNQFDITTLPNGIYFLEIIAPEKLYMARFCKD